MSIWYHPAYNLIGQLYSRPKHGPIYYYNRAKYRMYVSTKTPAITNAINNKKYQGAYPITTTPEQHGWVMIGWVD